MTRILGRRGFTVGRYHRIWTGVFWVVGVGYRLLCVFGYLDYQPRLATHWVKVILGVEDGMMEAFLLASLDGGMLRWGDVMGLGRGRFEVFGHCVLGTQIVYCVLLGCGVSVGIVGLGCINRLYRETIILYHCLLYYHGILIKSYRLHPPNPLFKKHR